MPPNELEPIPGMRVRVRMYPNHRDEEIHPGTIVEVQPPGGVTGGWVGVLMDDRGGTTTTTLKNCTPIWREPVESVSDAPDVPATKIKLGMRIEVLEPTRFKGQTGTVSWVGVTGTSVNVLMDDDENLELCSTSCKIIGPAPELGMRVEAICQGWIGCKGVITEVERNKCAVKAKLDLPDDTERRYTWKHLKPIITVEDIPRAPLPKIGTYVEVTKEGPNIGNKGFVVTISKDEASVTVQLDVGVICHLHWCDCKLAMLPDLRGEGKHLPIGTHVTGQRRIEGGMEAIRGVIVSAWAHQPGIQPDDGSRLYFCLWDYVRKTPHRIGDDHSGADAPQISTVTPKRLHIAMIDPRPAWRHTALTCLADMLDGVPNEQCAVAVFPVAPGDYDAIVEKCIELVRMQDDTVRF